MKWNAQIRVLLPAKHIPSGATVSKATGTKPYTLVRELKLFANGTESERREVVPAPNTVFLLDDTRRDSIDQIEDETVLSWHTTPEELWSHCEDD